jgi:hypothetical protein
MKIETPENAPEAPEPAPDDQSGTPDDTATATDTASETPAPSLTLAGIVGQHVGAHPGFDPSIHAVDSATGEPKRRADGSYALKRGRKSGSSPLPSKDGVSQVKADAPQIGQAEQVTAAQVRISAEEAGRQSANLLINASVWICGEEIGKPQDRAEAEGLKLSFVNYYEARGVPNVPPEIGLFVAVFSYIAPRYSKSIEAKSKFEKLTIWIKSKIGG